MIHLDTSYLVDLLRETSRRKPGPATKRLAELRDERRGTKPGVFSTPSKPRPSPNT